MTSPAQRHMMRVSAAMTAQREAAPLRHATVYEQMLVKLAADQRTLKAIYSKELKAAKKRELLPFWLPWVNGVLEQGKGAQDDILMTVMLWRLDTGDIAGALEIARYALKYGLTMPGKHRRTPPYMFTEEVALAAMRAHAAGESVDPRLLTDTLELTATADMPDEVRAKLHKITGLFLRDAGDAAGALAHLQRATQLDCQAGVKKEIERLERELKPKPEPQPKAAPRARAARRSVRVNHLTLHRRPPPDFSEVVMMTLIIPRKEAPVSGEGTVVIPQPAGDEPVIKNTFFFPDIDPKRVRERMRLEQTVAPARLREAIKSGMAETNAELYEYREQKIAAGFTRLADVPADDIDGESIKVFYYERAVCAMATASLYERYRGVDASAKGDKKADSIDSTIDELWRDMRWAVARIQDKPRCIVSQI